MELVLRKKIGNSGRKKLYRATDSRGNVKDFEGAKALAEYMGVALVTVYNAVWGKRKVRGCRIETVEADE